jgi:hypothetical protein
MIRENAGRRFYGRFVVVAAVSAAKNKKGSTKDPAPFRFGRQAKGVNSLRSVFPDFIPCDSWAKILHRWKRRPLVLRRGAVPFS